MSVGKTYFDLLDELLWRPVHDALPSIYISPELYEQLVKADRRARKRHGTIVQKERAQLKRLRREQNKRRRKLEEHFRRKYAH